MMVDKGVDIAHSLTSNTVRGVTVVTTILYDIAPFRVGAWLRHLLDGRRRQRQPRPLDLNGLSPHLLQDLGLVDMATAELDARSRRQALRRRLGQREG
jgi:hypothetical protein